MLKKLKGYKNRKGYTLVEVLTVVLIIAVLCAIALPSYRFAAEKARARQGITTLNKIAKAQSAYNTRFGQYSQTLSPLPLELKNIDNTFVSGDGFEDEYFNYMIYGNDSKSSAALRKQGSYELSIAYDTGIISCTPQENKICKMVTLEQQNMYAQSGQGGEIPPPHEEVLEDTEEPLNGLICYPEEGVCRTYEDNNLIAECEINQEGTGCLTAPESEYTFECDFEQGICDIYQDGNQIDQCALSDEGCYQKYNITGLVCDKDNGVCYTYQNGEIVDECPINDTGDGCEIPSSLEPDPEPDPQEVPEPLVENPNGFICYHGFEMCYLYENGEVVYQCPLGEEECFEMIYDGGVLCVYEDRNCEVWKDGEPYMGCELNEGICTVYATGEVCQANETGIGCYRSYSPYQIVCSSWGICYVYDSGKILGKCPPNDFGSDCEKEFTPAGELVGKIRCEPKDDTCYFYDVSGELLGSCKGINKTGDGCATDILD